MNYQISSEKIFSKNFENLVRIGPLVALYMVRKIF
jgi:hypothetical protein